MPAPIPLHARWPTGKQHHRLGPSENRRTLPQSIWAKSYHKHTGENGFGAEDLFAYVYAVLHDPDYLYTYETDLRREFPRLPLYRDFDQWVKDGAGAIGFAPGL